MRNKRHKYPVFLAKVSKIFETSLIKKGAMKKVQKYGKILLRSSRFSCI